MPDTSELLFEVMTALGFQVRVTKAYWKIITTIKHPVMAGREVDVEDTLKTPMKSALVKETPMSIYSTNPNALKGGFAQLQNALTVKDFSLQLTRPMR